MPLLLGAQRSLEKLRPIDTVACKTQFYPWSKQSPKLGTRTDSSLLQLAKLKPGDQVNVEVHSGGTITLTPMEDQDIDEEEAATSAGSIIEKNSELFRKLS